MQQIHAGLMTQQRAAADVPHSIAASVGSVAPSLRERGLGVRAKYLLKPDAAGLKVATLASLFDLRSSTLTPALARRERVSYTSRGRFMSMTFTTVLELRPVI
jgi:hypothetical protein